MQFRVVRGYLIMLTFLVTGIYSVPAQNGKLKSFGELPGPEKGWVITHPFKASKAHLISVEAMEVSKEMEALLGKDYQGGAIDAFRHTYWMARLTQEIGEKAAASLGYAHEKGNRKDFKKGRLEDGGVADAVSEKMDLWNNKTGRNIACNHPDANKEDLIRIITTSLKNGELKMILKDQKGNYLDQNGRIIQSHLLLEWENPKVLIDSELKVNSEIRN